MPLSPLEEALRARIREPSDESSAEIAAMRQELAAAGINFIRARDGHRPACCLLARAFVVFTHSGGALRARFDQDVLRPPYPPAESLVVALNAVPVSCTPGATTVIDAETSRKILGLP